MSTFNEMEPEQREYMIEFYKDTAEDCRAFAVACGTTPDMVLQMEIARLLTELLMSTLPDDTDEPWRRGLEK
jgi:hypothetical protein